ncbi:MAG: response regulator [Chloroflexia bacterium]
MLSNHPKTWATIRPTRPIQSPGDNVLKTILIIEDERVIAEILCAVLEDEGYRVHVADNGKEGIAALKPVRPDLVLCDLMMPVADGKAVARTMNSDPRYRSIPLILMSAGGTPPTDPGIHYAAFIRKPFDLSQLISVVERWVA